MREPMALLGLLPLLPYIICLYISYRMPHVTSGGFWRWIRGWAAFGIFTILFAIARTRVVLQEAYGDIPMDWTRFTLVSIGSLCLLDFVLSQRSVHPNGEHTLWDDLRADAARLWSVLHRIGRHP